MTLRIGVNALYLIPGGVGGTEIYLRSLLAALAEIDRTNPYVVFTNRETGPDLVPPQANFTCVPQAVRAVNRPARLHLTAHLIHRVDRIDGRRAGVPERLINKFDLATEFREARATEGKPALGDSVGRGCADGARAAHDHIGDGLRGGSEIRHSHDLEFMRQKPLLNELNAIRSAVEGDGAIVAGAAANSDIHASRLSKAVADEKPRFTVRRCGSLLAAPRIPPYKLFRRLCTNQLKPLCLTGRFISPTRFSCSREFRFSGSRPDGSPCGSRFSSRSF